MKISIHGTDYSFELYEDNGGHRHLFAFLGDPDISTLVAGLTGTYDETAAVIANMLSYDALEPDQWEGQYDNGLFGEYEDDDKADLETIDFVRAAYTEICELESHRNGGVDKII